MSISRRSIVASAAALPALAVPVMALPKGRRGFDRAAMIQRAEQLVEILSTCYVREGWHESLDRNRAAKFLENVRRHKLSAEDTDLETEIMNWVFDHGQSLDWLLVGDPRGLICAQTPEKRGPGHASIRPCLAPSYPCVKSIRPETNKQSAGSVAAD
jgi:hypothetical protein